MGSYAGQLSAGDRWRVAMYVMSAFKKNAAPAAATTATATPAAATTETKTTTETKK
ncbi:hypothetical protein QF044_003857 [Chryseobacterium sp. W4I1]|nr:hypothetical protein [Chryseobacterium sp. W4I1]